MNIGIIGGGAIGLLFATYLGRHHDVTVYCRSKDQAERLNEQNASLLKDNVKQPVKLHGSSDKHYHNHQIFIVAVKQYHLPQMMDALHQIPTHIPLLFLQNGIGHIPYIETLPHQSIWLGTVEHGALKLDATTVKHTGAGITKVAVFKGNKELLHSHIHDLEQAQFPFSIFEDYKEIIYQKLVINASINPLTAILKVKNGQLISNPFYFELLKKVCQEVCLVLSFSDVSHTFNQVIKICENTKDNTSSMLKDIQLQQRTEIDAIVGALIQKGMEKNKETPILNFLYHAVKGLEKEVGVSVE